jgi:outer membrane protein insertion porin family
MSRGIIGILLALWLPLALSSQEISTTTTKSLSYAAPVEYEIGGITISGAEYFDHTAIRALTGLRVGDRITIPGKKITEAVKNLWDQRLFSNVEITLTNVEGDKAFINVHITGRPRLSKFKFKGVKKGEADDLRESIKLIRGKVVTENLLVETKNKVKDYFLEKGYLNTEVNIIQETDTSFNNNVVLTIDIKKNGRIKIKNINFYGNTSIRSGKLRKAMKETKRRRFYNIFTVSKFIADNYELDKAAIIQKYNQKGYRDAKIKVDSVYRINDKLVSIDIHIEEGKKYYFRHIKWIGNTKYSTPFLSKVLGIKRGDVYNRELLDSRLQQDKNGRDISSLYMDDGYLFFNINAVETLIEGDSIDFEIQMYEGKQARINRVTVIGNTKTNDHVVMREIRTRPGNLFSRSDIIRTHRELAQLGYFDPEKSNQNIVPNQEEGTVDIEYIVEEKPSDQIELSGGWGGGRVVGSLGVSFTNFSTRNFFKKDAWRPLPSGDGQRLSVRAQTNGRFFQQYSLGFTEPWLGGKKPHALSISLYQQVSTNGERKKITDDDGNKITNPNRQAINIYGVSAGLGRQLQWPDDYFILNTDLSYQYYVLQNSFSNFVFANGFANNLSATIRLTRNSIDAPIYPRSGSQTSITSQFTFPYSLTDGVDDYDALSERQKYKWIEYHKWKFNTSWFTKLAGNLVLNTKVGYGFLGFYNRDLGPAPFERFYLGGDGLTGFTLDGREVIALRGYGNGDLSPNTGATSVAKYTMELRYPLSLNPSATIYGLTFVEAGDSWNKFSDFSPFEVNRSVGFGVRIFMPFFGLLGLDWGYRLDDIPGVSDPTKKSEIHFTIGGNIGGW